MYSHNASPLILPRKNNKGIYQSIAVEQAGWQFINFESRLLKQGDLWHHNTEGNEYAIVVLGGICSIESTLGNWFNVGKRKNVFEGKPYAIYLPRNTEFAVYADSDELDLAYAWCTTDENHYAKLITPEEVEVAIIGGGNATRQINYIIPPKFYCKHLIVSEVFIPSGNWSSFPPHKHDMLIEKDGQLIEANMEEIIFYKMDKPDGYAIQQIYTEDLRVNELVIAHNNDVVIVSEGYHPVVASHGYDMYCLNFLAGNIKSFQSTYHPAFDWIRNTWNEKDKRLPMVR